MSEQKHFLKTHLIMDKADFQKYSEEWRKIDPNIILLPPYVDLVYPAQCWIPMSITKPPVAKHVLVTIKWADDDYEVTEADYGLWVYTDHPALNKIVAWMYMPEPYKAEQRKEE